MQPDKTSVKAAYVLSWMAAAIIALIPFHAFLTVWLSSVLGHYTLLRLWKEGLSAVILLGCVYILARDGQLRTKLFKSWLVRVIFIYAAIMLIQGFIALAMHNVSAKALAYGELVDLRFLGFFLLVLVLAAKSSLLQNTWRRLILLPAAVVIIFGLLQYWVLPYDFLKHFGYGPNTISPYETINHNLNYLRIESTLRGANPLGAYLVLVISTTVALLLAAKEKVKYGVFLAIAIVALALSFSRSAWIGAAASVILIIWLSLKSEQLRQRLLIAAAVLLVVGCGVAFTLRNNTTLQNDILHTDNHSTAAQSSNQGHAAAFKSGLRDIGHQPWGDGVGSAGPQSVYSNHPGRLAENYFLQIGQEAGIQAIALFVLINIMVGRLLWQRRADPLAVALLASLAGLSFVNFLSHAWTDDTLSYLWWGLAGIALAPAILEHKGNKSGQKVKTAA